jgi:hypothetical protein
MAQLTGDAILRAVDAEFDRMVNYTRPHDPPQNQNGRYEPNVDIRANNWAAVVGAIGAQEPNQHVTQVDAEVILAREPTAPVDELGATPAPVREMVIRPELPTTIVPQGHWITDIEEFEGPGGYTLPITGQREF